MNNKVVLTEEIFEVLTEKIQRALKENPCNCPELLFTTQNYNYTERKNNHGYTLKLVLDSKEITKKDSD